jgi:F0F1-type ATP synthase membrane subunit b/b'
MEHEPVLIPNYTLFIQLGLFFATYFVLQFLVFKPYLALLKLRRQRTQGLKEEASQTQEKAQKLREDYEAFMKNERKRVQAWTEQEKKQVQDEERRVIAAARSAAGEELKTVRGRIQSESDKARQQLLPLVSEYSSQLVSKLLGRKVHISGTAAQASKGNDTEVRVPTP